MAIFNLYTRKKPANR